MLRVPEIRIVAPKSLREAARILKKAGPRGCALSGGTDLIPKLKRGQQLPNILVDLGVIPGLDRVERSGGEVVIGARTTIASLIRSPLLSGFGALREAAACVASPQIRNLATVGGNLTVDTRCCFYDQGEGWRKSQGFCMKTTAGAPCRVAPKSPHCLAISSGDLPPALIALGARVRIQGPAGERELALEDIYRDVGCDFLKLRSDEIISAILLKPAPSYSTYRKLRRRESFDFPSMSIAAALEYRGGVARNVRIVLGSVASAPLLAVEAAALLEGKRPTRERIDAAAIAALRLAKPVENADFTAAYRRRMVKVFVARALKDLTSPPGRNPTASGGGTSSRYRSVGDKK